MNGANVDVDLKSESQKEQKLQQNSPEHTSTSADNNLTVTIPDEANENSRNRTPDLIEQDLKPTEIQNVERQNSMKTDSDSDFGQGRSSSEEGSSSPGRKRKEREEKASTISQNPTKKSPRSPRKRRNSDPGKNKTTPWIPAGIFEPPLPIYPIEPSPEPHKTTEKKHPIVPLLPWFPPGVSLTSHNTLVQAHITLPDAKKQKKVHDTHTSPRGTPKLQRQLSYSNSAVTSPLPLSPRSSAQQKPPKPGTPRGQNLIITESTTPISTSPQTVSDTVHHQTPSHRLDKSKSPIPELKTHKITTDDTDTKDTKDNKDNNSKDNSREKTPTTTSSHTPMTHTPSSSKSTTPRAGARERLTSPRVQKPANSHPSSAHRAPRPSSNKDDDRLSFSDSQSTDEENSRDLRQLHTPKSDIIDSVLTPTSTQTTTTTTTTSKDDVIEDVQTHQRQSPQLEKEKPEVDTEITAANNNNNNSNTTNKDNHTPISIDRSRSSSTPPIGSKPGPKQSVTPTKDFSPSASKGQIDKKPPVKQQPEKKQLHLFPFRVILNYNIQLRI